MRREGRKATDADYGMGEHTIDCDGMGLVDEQELSDRLIRTFEAPNYKPPRLPTVAMELNALSRKPDVEFRDLEVLLEQDAMLAGEVLSLSRSAFYSGLRQVGSLREALVRLGLDKLREVVLQAAMNMRVFRSKTHRGAMERLKNHSRATAHVCRLVSQYTPIAEETAFLCGLLHDVGIAGILLILADGERGGKSRDLSVLWPAIDAAHAKAGARMVQLWDLPPEVSMAVGAHHQVVLDGYDHPVAATVCIAEAIATELGMGFVPADLPEESEIEFLSRIDRSDERTLQRARGALGLAESAVKLIRLAATEWAESEAVSVEV